TADVEALLEAFSGRSNAKLDIDEIDAGTTDAIPASLARRAPPLRHPIFSLYRSETEMMRYLARLREKDVSLTRSMIPLGSCTMKLNSAVEMLPITWP